MDFETRQRLRHEVSDIQREKERLARFTRVHTLYGERIHMGGGSRPKDKQVRSGYPHPDDIFEAKRRRQLARELTLREMREAQERSLPTGSPDIVDTRDLRDPTEVGEAWLNRNQGQNGRVQALEEPITQSRIERPDSLGLEE